MKYVSAPGGEEGLLNAEARVRCRRLSLGGGSRVEAGAVVECEEFELGPGAVVGAGAHISGGSVRLGRGFRVGAGSVVRAQEFLVAGPLGRFGERNTVEVRRARFGRELYTGPEARVGGGSWAEAQSEFECGYWVHLGMRVFVNTARRVSIGNEVGIGTDSRIFTHGAYQSALDGYPVRFAGVSIGDNCWLPGAVVNPGVVIGPGCVVGVGSVVSRSLPAGCLAAGIPCRVLREGAFPRRLDDVERLAVLRELAAAAGPVAGDVLGASVRFDADGLGFSVAGRAVRLDAARVVVRGERPGGDTVFQLRERCVVGPADELSEKLRDLLRRYGIRFRVEVRNGEYGEWEEE